MHLSLCVLCMMRTCCSHAPTHAHTHTHKHTDTRARTHTHTHTHQVSAEEAQERCLRANDVVALERSELLRLSLTDAWPLLDSMPNLWYAPRDLAHRHRHRGGRGGVKRRRENLHSNMYTETNIDV